MKYHGLTPCFLLWLFKHNIDNYERRIIISICNPFLTQVPRVSEINQEKRSHTQSKKHIESNVVLFTKLCIFFPFFDSQIFCNCENPSQHCRDVSITFCLFEKPKLYLNWFFFATACPTS